MANGNPAPRAKGDMTFKAWLIVTNVKSGHMTQHILEHTNVGVVEKHIRRVGEQLPHDIFELTVIRFYYAKEGDRHVVQSAQGVEHR